MTSDGEGAAALEREVRALRAQLRSLIDRNADAVLVVDADGVVRFANPAAEPLLGRPVTDLVGATLGIPLLAGETTELDLVRSGCVAEMRVVETEWDGQPAVLAVLRDISERKRAEQQREQLLMERLAREQAEYALRERDEFMALASHELKTPAATLSASAQLLNRQLQRQGSLDPEQQQRALERLHDQSQRLARLIDHLLDVSRINSGHMSVEPHEFDLVRLVGDVIASCQVTTNRHTIVYSGPRQLEIVADPVRIEQVVTNLVDNAIKYSPDGGEVAVSLALPSLDTVELRVRDHGIGVPEDRRERLFERFFRAHAEGSVSGMGLGLFITRHLVELHGGSISVEDPPDGGSQFKVTLPIAGITGGSARQLH